MILVLLNDWILPDVAFDVDQCRSTRTNLLPCDDPFEAKGMHVTRGQLSLLNVDSVDVYNRQLGHLVRFEH